MRFERDGISLWYGTPDAPAPGEAVEAGSIITITVAVQPPDASHKLAVYYRVNGGPPEAVAAGFLRNDPGRKAQYFIARLPAFRPGDTVDYTAVCRCAGRQVPSPEEEHQYPASFRVIESLAKPTPRLAPHDGPARPPIAGPPVPVAAILSPPSPPAAPPHPLPLPPTAAAVTMAGAPAAASQPPPLTGSTMNGSRLHSDEARKAEIASLLGTSPLVAAHQLHERFISLYVAHVGSHEDFWDKLRQDPAFQAPGTIEDLQFTCQLGLLTLNNVPLIKALHKQTAVKSPRDLLGWDTHAWTQLLKTPVDGQAIPMPDSVPGETSEAKTANYVGAMMHLLHQAFPTAIMAQSLRAHPDIDPHLVQTVLARNPKVDPARRLPPNVDLTGLSADDQAKAKASIEALRQEINMFSGFDYKAWLQSGVADRQARIASNAVRLPYHNPLRDGVATFLANSPDFNFQTTHIDSYIAANASTAFQGISERDRPAVIVQLKRTQRVFRVTPDSNQIKVLMGEGFDSAQSIASVPQARFLKEFGDRLGGQQQAVLIHARAQHVAAAATMLFTQVHQALHEVTPRVIGGGV